MRGLYKPQPSHSNGRVPDACCDLLVESTLGNKVISFLDGNVGYNQIFMAKEDVSKTAFHYLGFVDLFEWIVMTFGLKNVGATYQRAMNLIFHDLLSFDGGLHRRRGG
jgi:hypothetical protein